MFALPMCLLAAAASACGGYGGKLKMATPYKMAANPNAPVAVADGARKPNTERYGKIVENEFRDTAKHPTCTFSIDVDTAAYSNVRRFLTSGKLPPRDAVRIEEMINYFGYDYPEPTGNQPFSIITEVGPAPWNAKHELLHIGLKGRSIAADKMPARNLVFLLDVSGSMGSSDKLPLLMRGLSLLVNNLNENDSVAIVVYAGASGVVLPPTRGDDKHAILGALNRLRAGGSTNGGAGINLAYALAQKHFDKNGINRVILATDGDFNVGSTSRSALVELIERKRKSGVYLSVLGFGRGNIKDDTMEMLADKGNGNYAYIDSLAEARKVLVTQAGGTLVTIAKDVKIQLALDAKQVASYRLIGYENRMLSKEDFKDDRKDAGEIGAGHTVTALYELVPADGATGASVATVKLRYKQPKATKSVGFQVPVTGARADLKATSTDFKLSAAVAAFGMLLRDSKHKGTASYAMAAQLAEASLRRDAHGYRRQLVGLINKAAALAGHTSKAVAR